MLPAYSVDSSEDARLSPGAKLRAYVSSEGLASTSPISAATSVLRVNRRELLGGLTAAAIVARPGTAAAERVAFWKG